MACFRMPESLCQDINIMMVNFCWDQTKEETKLCWIAWRHLCGPKIQGVLGFKDINAFNMAFLAKQGWRILNNPHSLLARVLKGKYFPFTSFLESHIGSNPSWGWKSIMSGRRVIEKGVRWQVSNWQSVLCKVDNWVPNCFPNPPKVKPQHDESVVWVKQLMNDSEPSWDIHQLKENFVEEDVNNILVIAIVIFRRDDQITWHFTRHGKFVVRSGCFVAKDLLSSRDRVGTAGRGEQFSV
ncbi:hypothetical protein P3X46_033428 [Hevea brasiliensis]|uniref:Reverse transcriptase zinc-binding domain-containing protein n=1 Tax=Hevea brasiliensis TaxID=3981 RepID=A0ABQ9KJA5_HEVBR|nr:hypothetical protein P3X46_033428 [Hevea brasiliensis]